MRGYTPAMEFAGPVDFTREIVTYRSEKWRGRIKPGDVIEVEKVHQLQPGRHFAVIIAVDDQPPPPGERAKLAFVYPGVKTFVRVVLRVDDSVSKQHPRFVTWQTKTTRLLFDRA